MTHACPTRRASVLVDAACRCDAAAPRGRWWPACRHPYGSRPGECARAGCRGAGLNAFSSIALREFRRAWRGGGLWPPIAFFVLVAILFPFAIGPDSRLLARAGAGVAWVAALLAALLPVERLRTEERRVGTECVRKGRSRWGRYHK